MNEKIAIHHFKTFFFALSLLADEIILLIFFLLHHHHYLRWCLMNLNSIHRKISSLLSSINWLSLHDAIGYEIIFRFFFSISHIHTHTHKRGEGNNPPLLNGKVNFISQQFYVCDYLVNIWKPLRENSYNQSKSFTLLCICLP